MSADEHGLSGNLKLTAGPFELAPLSVSDAADVLAEFSDPRVVEWMDIEPLRTTAEAISIIRWAEDRRALEAGIRWAIRERAGGAFVGTCGYNNIFLERGRRGEIAYDLRHVWQRRGVMGQVLPRVIDFGWKELALHRLEALVTPGNDRSCALLERHGFTREGVLAGFGFWKGRYWDQIVYGLTRPAMAPTL